MFYALVFVFYGFFQIFNMPKKLTINYLCICLRLIKIDNEKGEEEHGTEFKQERFETIGEIIDSLNRIREKRKKG